MDSTVLVHENFSFEYRYRFNMMGQQFSVVPALRVQGAEAPECFFDGRGGRHVVPQNRHVKGHHPFVCLIAGGELLFVYSPFKKYFILVIQEWENRSIGSRAQRQALY